MVGVAGADVRPAEGHVLGRGEASSDEDEGSERLDVLGLFAREEEGSRPQLDFPVEGAGGAETVDNGERRHPRRPDVKPVSLDDFEVLDGEGLELG